MTGWERIVVIVSKDLRSFLRDRFYVVISLVGLVFFVLVFWLLPATVDESVTVGVSQTGLDEFFALFDQAEADGIEIVAFQSEQQLRAALEAGDDILVGLAFPDDFLAAIRGGRRSLVTVYLGGEVPPEYRTAASSFVREIAYLAAGEVPPFTQPTEEETIVGVDRAGDQVALRERMRPLLAFMVLLLEAFALASLVAGEIAERTVTAVLVTPATVADFLTAKCLTGTGLAFVQGLVVMAATGTLAFNPPLLLTTLLLGSLLITGMALVAGSSGRDFIGIVFWTMLLIIPLLIPAFAVLFPGSAAAWVRILPSYPLVDTLVSITTAGAGWGDSVVGLAALTGWGVAAMAVGWLVLRRKVVAV